MAVAQFPRIQASQPRNPRAGIEAMPSAMQKRARSKRARPIMQKRARSKRAQPIMQKRARSKRARPQSGRFPWGTLCKTPHEVRVPDRGSDRSDAITQAKTEIEAQMETPSPNELALGVVKIDPLTGNEDMPGLDAKVIDFWRWAFSDLMMNTARGVLAEFIVAKALGISTEGVRAGWDPFDLETEDGIKIEVKSASYVQSWAQNDYSKIQFSVAPKRGWDINTNKQGTEAARHADYYVFALLAEKDQTRIDPTNVSQWRFWIVA